MTFDVTTSLPAFPDVNASALVGFKGRPPLPQPSAWRSAEEDAEGVFLSPQPRFVFNLTEAFYGLEEVSSKQLPSSLPTAWAKNSSFYDYGNVSTELTYVVTTNQSTGSGNGSDEALLWMKDIVLGVVLFTLCLLTFVGNAMVLHAVRTERRLQSVSNMFIVSLAIADLIVGLIVMPISAIYIFTEEWLFGVGICQFWIGVDYTASTASILNLLILSLDRYWSVTAPLRYLRKRTKRRALIMISLVWSASSLWLIPIIGWHHFEHGGIRTVPDDTCDTEYATNTPLKIITGILNYYLPLAIMYGLYTKIFMEIHKRSKMEIGQRINCSGARELSLGPTTSLSEDSDERNRQHALMGNSTPVTDPPPVYNGKLAHAYRADSDDSALHQRQEVETATETEDEELARLHKDGYTNLRLVRATTSGSEQPATRTYANSSDVMSSDSECRSHYVYDEGVVDHTTEKVHHFLYEEQPLPLSRCNSKTGAAADAGSKVAETSAAPPDVYSEKDVRFHLTDARQDATEKTLTKFPKEPHPAKNKYVKPRTRVVNGQEVSYDTRGGSRRLPRTPSPQPPSRASCLKLSKPRQGGKVASFRRPVSRVGTTDNGNNGGVLGQVGKDVVKNGQDLSRQQANRSALIKQAVRWKRKLDKKKHTPSMALHKEIKAARQLGVIMGAFTVCFFPYFVCFMVVAFCDDCVSANLMTIVTWFGYLNSTLNPFLYPLCNMHFRRKFRKMLRLKAPASETRRSSKYFPMSSYHRHVNSSYDPP